MDAWQTMPSGMPSYAMAVGFSGELAFELHIAAEQLYLVADSDEGGAAITSSHLAFVKPNPCALKKDIVIGSQFID